jgi:hypothetical protein
VSDRLASGVIEMTSDVDRPAARELAGLAVTHVWTSDEDAVPQSRLGWLARAWRITRGRVTR